MAPCLKCGQKFKIVFEDEPLTGPPPVATEKQATADTGKEAETQETNIPELESLGFKLVISADRLSARLFSPESLPDSITLEALKEYISQKGIVYGLIGDDDFSDILASQRPKEEGWLIAEGTPPQSGVDAKIIYHFDTEAYKVGTVRESGIIDFKDKGEIQQVNAGCLLAEKVPLVKEVFGKDVLGQSIPVDQAQDVLLRPGKTPRFQKMD